MLGVTASSVPTTPATHVNSASIRKSGTLMIRRALGPHPGCGPVKTLRARDSAALCRSPDRRDLVVRDEPVAVDLPKARGPPKPEIGPVAVLQRAAHPIEAVPECHVIAQGER